MSSTITAIALPEYDDELVQARARIERTLLAIAAAFILINQVALIIARSRSWTTLWPVAVWAVCAMVGHTLLRQRLPGRDPLLFPLAMFLTGWGLNLISRLVPGYMGRQTLWLVIGLAVMLALTFAPGDLRWLRRYRYTWLIGGLALLGITILLGQNPSGEGPRLWLGFRGLYYQPSELLKILLVAFLASYFAEHAPYMRAESRRALRWSAPVPAFLGPVLLMWGVCVVVLVWQRDLGTATLFFLVFLIMLYLASGQMTLLLGGIGLLALASLAAAQLFDVVGLRVRVWLDPWPTADSDAYQIVQSLIAVASGGLFGQGIGQGQPQIVPVVHSDFAFAAIGEEWGMLGMVAVTACLALIVVRGMRIAVEMRAPFERLLAAGLSVMLAVQALLIMAGVLKLIPLTGITLPFVSYGGSSLLTMFVMTGLLLILSNRERETL